MQTCLDHMTLLLVAANAVFTFVHVKLRLRFLWYKQKLFMQIRTQAIFVKLVTPI